MALSTHMAKFSKKLGKNSNEVAKGLLENGDFDEYGEFGENGEFGKNGDYGKKITIDDGQSFDLKTNSLNQFSKEKYGDQSKEFVIIKGLMLSCMG